MATAAQTMNAASRTIEFQLNGKEVTANMFPRHTLVELVQRFALFGARESCGQGLCGFAAYPEIIDAVKLAARKRKGGS